jgi:hypothetical protein
MKECTFSPRVNRSRSRAGQRRNYNDLLAWGDEKRLKQTNTRLNSMMKEAQCSFSPNINPKSRQLAGNRAGPVHNRLHNAGEDANQRLEDLKAREAREMFKPSIGWRSRQLANKVADRTLVK